MTSEIENLRPADLGRHLRNFALTFTLLSVAVAVIAQFTQLSGSGMGVVTLLAASTLPAQQFARDNGRAMTRPERLRFSLWATCISIAISLTLFATVVVALSGTGGIETSLSQARKFLGDNLALASIIAAVTFVVSFAVIFVTLTIFGKYALKAQSK